MKKDVEAFKKELANYNYYKRNLEGTLELIQINEDLLSNLHGFDPSRPHFPSHTVWVETDTFRRISDELERLNKRKVLREAQIEYIEEILSKMTPEMKEACIEIYSNNRSYAEIGRLNHYSKTGLWFRIKSELDKALE